MKFAGVLALCALGAVSGTDKTESTTNNRHRRASGPSGTELFLSIVGERPSENNQIKSSLLPVQLPIQLGGHGGVTLPILVLPVPIYTNNPDSCSANHASTAAQPAQALPNIPIVQIRQQFSQAQTQPQTVPESQETIPNQQTENTNTHHEAVQSNPAATQLHQSQQHETTNAHQEAIQINELLQDVEPQSPSYQPVKTYASAKVVIPTPGNVPHKESLNFNLGSNDRVTFKVDESQVQEPVNYEQTTVEEEEVPFSDGSPIFETSEQMIQSFLRQTPVAPEEPAVIPDLDLPARLPVTSSSSSYGAPSITAASPPRPDFNRSLHLRVDLTVPSSDYTEAYDIQWHSESNTAKTVIEDGSTVIYRAPLADGRIQFLEVLRHGFIIIILELHDLVIIITDLDYYFLMARITIEEKRFKSISQAIREFIDVWPYEANCNRQSHSPIKFFQIQRELTDGQEVRRCTLSPLMQASPADNAFPGLPEFDQFEFVGYTTAEGRSLVERWRRVVTGGPGEGGAAEGESLTITHEMFIIRERGQAVPLRYSVVTDSSVLGAKSDSYTHRYNLLDAPTSAVLPDTSRECDAFEEYPVQLEQHSLQKRAIGLVSRVLAKFDPIREFAGPTRDVRYDSILTNFKNQFKRKYLDPAEEAVRKNLLVKSSRFIEAGNRLASGFKMAANFLADRLDDEINQLFGVQEPPVGASEPGLVPFPYTENEVKNIKLDDEFDWRPLGAVSPVRFQDTTCSSCWAFAVAGSTEGALFKKTNKLVPLSPQCLVDCGKPFGTNGCNGTWPSFAYDYVQARGLPAWDEYTNYQAKVLQCKDKTVPPVTHISGHVNVTAFSEEALKVAIKNHAPSVVIVDAKAQSFIYYKSGVLKDKRCGENKPRLNHAVLAVGWGSKDGSHFIIKNTWSDKWGEGGYIRIAPDSCAILERPSYSLVEEPNIDRAELRAAAASLKA
ncbi:uncharacterized protein LOC133530035 isoform X1 [Cydia pomonella]|uniref:uncharacterized protein LOC133530035 isoform X1 n=1 Tax=Cydia pomonella TaxID=82600 RepID=UPI002ADDFB8F|nr:uncharacterized protein LOC133530035 isoform X1 [Cydia pomonella]